MNYNMETINNLAEQLALMFKSIVNEQQKSGQGTPPIAEIGLGCGKP